MLKIHLLKFLKTVDQSMCAHPYCELGGHFSSDSSDACLALSTGLALSDRSRRLSSGFQRLGSAPASRSHRRAARVRFLNQTHERLFFGHEERPYCDPNIVSFPDPWRKKRVL